MAAAIVFALRQADTGTVVAEVCRKMGISEATAAADRFYNWKKKYGGLAWAFPNFDDFVSLKKRTNS